MGGTRRSATEEAFLEIRRQPRLDEREIAERLARAFSIPAWEALSPSLSIDATLDNGCMYIVPKHLLPESMPDDFANNAGGISPEVWRTMLQGARALPAQAGSVLAWDFQVIHRSSFERLRAIAKGILSYQRFEPAVLRYAGVGSSRVDLQACKLEYSIVSPK